MATKDLRVAIVDDNKDAVAGLARLISLAGFKVVARITEPTMAFDYIAEEQPDVVLLDIGMPFIDGYTLAGRLKKHFVPTPKLIAVTGYGSPEDKAQAADAGFDAHFVKPVNWQKLHGLLTSYAQS